MAGHNDYLVHDQATDCLLSQREEEPGKPGHGASAFTPALTDDRFKDSIWSYHEEAELLKLSSQIKPISYLKAHAAEIVRSLEENGGPLIITQNGEAKVVMEDIESYEQTQETMALLKILALARSRRAHEATRVQEGRLMSFQVFRTVDAVADRPCHCLVQGHAGQPTQPVQGTS